MASRICRTLNKVALLPAILWSGMFVTFFGVGVALAVTVNPWILFVFVVLGLSLSTIAVDSVKIKMKASHDVKPQRISSSPGLCVAKLETSAPSYAEEKITIYPASSTTTSVSGPCPCIQPNVTVMRSYSGSRIYSSDERTVPRTHVPRRNTTQLLPGPTDLLSVPIRSALPGLKTSSHSATCKGVGTLSYHRPYGCYEGHKAYRIYDLSSEESYNTSAGFGTLDTTEDLYEDNLPGPVNLLSVPIRPALPDLETSSDSAICEGVRSLSYHGPYSCSEGRKAYRIYDLSSEESYDTSAGLVTLDTTEALYEDNLVRTPSKTEKIANRSPEPKSVSWDMGTTGRTRPAEGVRKGDNEVPSVTSSVANETVVKPQVRPQETAVIATKADANDKVAIGKEGGSDISQEAEDKSSSEDMVDLQAKCSGAPSKVSVSPLGSRNTDRTCKGKVYESDISLQQVSISDLEDNEDSTRPESEIAWVSLSAPTRRSGVLPGDETSGTTDEQPLSLERDQPLEDSIQQELPMPFNGLNHSKPRRSKSAAFSAGDKAHRDRRSHGSSKSAHSVKDSASQTSLTASRGGDRDGCSVAPLVKAEVVKVTVINSPLSEESSQQSSTGRTEPRNVTSCSEYVQATAKMRNRAVQSEDRQAAPESPKKKRLTGRLSMFLRPCKRKQGITSYYREQRSK